MDRLKTGNLSFAIKSAISNCLLPLPYDSGLATALLEGRGMRSAVRCIRAGGDSSWDNGDFSKLGMHGENGLHFWCEF